MTTPITVEALIAAPIEKIWNYWTSPEHIIHWNFASDDWCAPVATNDFTVGGQFSCRMEAKDGSMGFDFYGTYTGIRLYESIAYTMGDDRKVKIDFVNEGDQYLLIETFEAEQTNPIELQQHGWQAILNNFKQYVETN
jgi:uncharacterized protein YndB with AHSA1/START domain